MNKEKICQKAFSFNLFFIGSSVSLILLGLFYGWGDQRLLKVRCELLIAVASLVKRRL